MWDRLDRDERIKAIRDGVARGLSAAQIAVEIGGVSRNGVIGLAARAGVALRPHSSSARKQGDQRAKKAIVEQTRPPRQARKPEPKPKSAPLPVPEEERRPDSFYHTHLTQITDRKCRWPQWSDAGRQPLEAYIYCGRPTVKDSSYCQDCKRLAVAGRLGKNMEPVWDNAVNERAKGRRLRGESR